MNLVRSAAFITKILFLTVHSSEAELPKMIDSVQKLNEYFQRFFASNGSLTVEEWNLKLPSEDERLQMRALITQIYQFDDYKSQCSPSILREYNALRDVVNVTLFKEVFCVIHEHLPLGENETFSRLWGYTVIADPNVAKRRIHHSAAHFESDGDVCNEAAELFEITKSRSLVIAGANRYAVMGNTTGKCQPGQRLADAAHNNQTMFHNINEALKDAAASNNSNTDVFIQWHGMAETSCLPLLVYLSAGAGPTSSVYDDPDSTVNRMTRNFNEQKGGAETPRNSTNCSLVGGTNIFGRYVNGVPSSSVCFMNANDSNVLGAFLHIEQKRAARDDWKLWAAVIESSFPVSSNKAFAFRFSFVTLLFCVTFFSILH